MKLPTTFDGITCPGRFFTLIWSALMTSDRFLPSSVRELCTYICTCLWNNSGFLDALLPTILAIVVPLGRNKKLLVSREMHSDHYDFPCADNQSFTASCRQMLAISLTNFQSLSKLFFSHHCVLIAFLQRSKYLGIHSRT